MGIQRRISGRFLDEIYGVGVFVSIRGDVSRRQFGSA